MILFHGTPASKAHKILNDGLISNQAEANYNENCIAQITKCQEKQDVSLATTRGYVYLTNWLFKAVYYGNLYACTGNEKDFYIFMVDIDENRLLPDLDEPQLQSCIWTTIKKENVCDYTSYKDTLEEFRSVRYADSISKFKYCTLPSAMNTSDENSQLIKSIVDAYVDFSDNHSEAFLRYVEELKEQLVEKCIWR